MLLYSYFRSSAAYRVRIGLNLKGLTYETVAVHLTQNGGQQYSEHFLQVNPAALVPALQDQGAIFTQSLAILEYLDEQYPEAPLLPADPVRRAQARSLAMNIACDIHPLNNLRVLKYLKSTLGLDQDARDNWYRHWVELGLGAVEALLLQYQPQARYSFTDEPGLFEAVLIPQLANARRLGSCLDHVPHLLALEERCLALPAFIQAAPENQPDAS